MGGSSKGQQIRTQRALSTHPHPAGALPFIVPCVQLLFVTVMKYLTPTKLQSVTSLKGLQIPHSLNPSAP